MSDGYWDVDSSGSIWVESNTVDNPEFQHLIENLDD